MLRSPLSHLNDGTSKTSYSWGYSTSGTTMYYRDAENNLKYLYDYDSLGRLIRQEVQNSSNSAHIGRVEFGYDIRNNLTKVASEIGGYTAVDKYLYSEDSGNTKIDKTGDGSLSY